VISAAQSLVSSQRSSSPAHRPAATFVLASPEATLVADGARTVIRAPSSRLVPEVRAFLAARDGLDAAPALVGALPFDPSQDAYLIEPRAVTMTRPDGDAAPPAAAPASGARRTYRVTARPSRAEYERAVARALRLMTTEEDDRSPALRKVVLARSLVVEADAPIDVEALLTRLRRDRSVTAFRVPLPAEGSDPRVLVGATPELLVKRDGVAVTSMPLAGSARRRRDAALDRAAGEALLRSAKNRREHATVVEWIADTLAPYCIGLTVQSRPSIVSTSSMWHLATRIVGQLRQPAPSSLELAAALHPTPAVCGVPLDLARATIRELEPFDRGFFTGAVGWCAANGDGQWLVAIRCAQITGSTAELFAGAGIVPGSQPASEADETSAKFEALLDALALDEQGQALAEERRS
jgi:isochorismate synthase